MGPEWTEDRLAVATEHAEVAEKAGDAAQQLFARQWRILALAELGEMDEVDREVLVLRYFERLSNEETARALGLSVSGARKRHVRTLVQLRKDLAELGQISSGLLEE